MQSDPVNTGPISRADDSSSDALDATRSDESPSSGNGDGHGARHQAWCSASVPPGADRCPGCGVWQVANQGARTLGLYTQHKPVELRMTADELIAGVLADRGGDTEVTTLERSYIRKLADLEITIRLLTSDIAKRGLLTPGGRVRDVFPKLLAGLATFDRYATRIGLERRQKPVDTVDAYLRRVAQPAPGEDA